MTFDNQILLAIIAILAWLLVSGTRRCPKHESHTIGQRAVDAIAEARDSGRSPIYHAGCIGCIFSPLSDSHDGIAFCRGCQYYAPNWGLPSKRRAPTERG